MKITKSKLKQIIKEEINVLREAMDGMPGRDSGPEFTANYDDLFSDAGSAGDYTDAEKMGMAKLGGHPNAKGVSYVETELEKIAANPSKFSGLSRNQIMVYVGTLIDAQWGGYSNPEGLAMSAAKKA